MEHNHRLRSMSSLEEYDINLKKIPTQHENDETLTRLETSQSQMEPPKSLFQETIFVSVVCMAQLMIQASLSISIAPVHIIGDSFGTSNPANLVGLQPPTA
ncbi:hypothetical protein N7449_005658 [Penicillium cf. viridicatum]|uniref:Uncharacterized protein n=1 Tax=Penicillium cf. viridicatum TaxID=2972119 RepID=A0A9W9MLL3_9EURO|nr:hypothetical protein N7449_005658 [Penicillium cf. viridicatum]